MTAPLLLLAWGNRSRGDDALGPLLLQAVQDGLSERELAQIDFLEDYQLQVEHALDLVGRQRVLFIDASVGCAAPFEVTPLQAAQDASYTTHSLSPQAVMGVFQQLHGVAPPTSHQLAIRGLSFELGAPPSAEALANLQQATVWALQYVRDHLAQRTPPD